MFAGFKHDRARFALAARHPLLECLESRELLSITATADNYSTLNTTQLVVTAPGVLGNDIDTGGYTMTPHLSGGPTNGTLQLNSDGSFTYTPNPGYYGNDSFRYYDTDQHGGQSGIVSDTISVGMGIISGTDATKLPVDTLGVTRQILSDPYSQPIVSPLPAGGSGGTTISAEPADGAPATAHNLSLAYDSVAGHPDQVLEGDFQVDVNGGTPQTMTATATLNGAEAGTSYISTAYLTNEPTIHVAIQVDTSSLPTGRYPYSLTLSAANNVTINGFVNVVNNSASPFGMGWDMPGLYHLYQNNVQGVPAGVLLTDGTGSGWYFTASGGSYTSPNGPYAFDTLTSVNGGGWQLLDKYGTVFSFNSSGYLTSREERTLETTTYGWTNGDLTSITDAFGRSINLGYTSGLLSSIQDYASSTWSFAHTGSDLTSITLPNPGGGSPVWTYAYTGNYLSSVSDPDSNKTSYTLNSYNRVSNVSLPGGASTSAISEQNYGYGSTSHGNPQAAVLTSSVVPSTTDANQNTSDYQSDAFGDPTSQTDPYGNVTTIQRDANGLPTRVTLPPPQTGQQSPVTTISYDSMGNETSATGAQPTYGTWTYNSFGEWATFTDSTGKEWVRTFDGHGNVLTETDPLNNQVSWTYDPYGRPLTMTVPAPNNGTGTETTHYFYSSYERLAQITWPDNSTQVLSYNADDRPIVFTDENNHSTTTNRDVLGRVTSVVNAANGTVSYTYDKAGNLLTTTDEMSNVTTDQYDVRNELVQQTLPAPATGQTQPVLSWTYDANGNDLTFTDALSRVTSYAWDKLDRMASQTLPLPAAGKASPVTTYGYDNDSRKTSETNALSGTTSWAYANTDISQVTSETLPPPSGSGAGLATSFGYDSDGRRNSVTDAMNHTTITTFTADGEVSQIQDNLNHITSYSYGHLGELLSATDPLNHTSGDQYDSRFRIIQKTDDNNGVTSITLDPAGNETKLVDSVNNATSWTFDALNRPLTETNSQGTTTTSYDASSDVTSIQDADGRLRDFTFDNLHRLTAEHWMNGNTVVATMSYTYDLANQLTSASDPNSAYAFTYDGDGNVLSVDNNGTPNVPHVVLTNTFDLMGDRTSQSASVGGTLDYLNNYSYDADQRLTMVQQQQQTGGNAVASKEVDFAYNAIGQYTSLVYYNYIGVGPRIDVATGAYSYDGDNRLTGLAYTWNAGAHEIDTFGWTYDNASRVITFTSNDGTATYGYDPTNQLTSATYTTNSGGHQPANESFSFDLNGNRNSTGYTTGANNLITSDGTFNYQHDADGNQTVRTRISNSYASDYKTTYSWDYRNRLTDVEYFDNNSVMTKHVHFVYDVFDHLIATEVDTTGGGSYNQIQRYVLDVTPETPQAGVPGTALAQPVLMFDGNGNPTERVLEAVDRIFAEGSVSSLTQADTVNWDLVDNLGSLRYVLDNNSNVIDREVYSSFGQVAYESNPAVAHFTGFAGGHIDATTDLVGEYHRWYDPTTGKWSNADPLGFTARDTNMGRYASNSPTNLADPSGLIPGPINPVPPNPTKAQQEQASKLAALQMVQKMKQGYKDLAKEVALFLAPMAQQLKEKYENQALEIAGQIAIMRNLIDDLGKDIVQTEIALLIEKLQAIHEQHEYLQILIKWINQQFAEEFGAPKPPAPPHPGNPMPAPGGGYYA